MQKKAVVVGALGVIGRYSRLHGFHDAVDSEAMFVRLLRRFARSASSRNPKTRSPH